MILKVVRDRAHAYLMAAGLAASLVPAGGARADQNRQVLPAGTVIPVRLDGPIGSKTAHAGDQFTATVRFGRDDAGLPNGTRVQGVVQEALPAANGTPGVLDMGFSRVLFPDGRTQPIQGTLISPGAKGVQRGPSGVLTAAADPGGDRLKWVGVGAASGAAISALTHGKTLVNTLLGAGAGLFLHRLKRDDPGDVNLPAGTEFGIRLAQPLAFTLPEQGVDVFFNDRKIAFTSAKPFARGGMIFIPIDPVSQAAGFDYAYDPGQKVIRAGGGALRLNIGSNTATLNGKQRPLDAAAEVRDGVIYVPMQFLALATGGTAAVGASGRAAILTTDKAPGASPAGTYTATGPAADAPGLQLTLLLNADKTCVLTSDYLGKATIIEMGTWSSNGPLVTVALTSSSTAPENSRITFEWKDGALVAAPEERFPRLTLKKI